MNVLITLLLYLISFHSGYAQIISKENVQNYLNNLTILMRQNLKDYGISNLPDVDTKITYNIPKVYGYTLIGNLFLEDGFVMDISDVVLFSTENSAIVNPDISRISCDLKFEGLRILRDFRYESDSDDIEDQSFGSVVIAPNAFNPSIDITKYLENNTVKAEFKSGVPLYQPGKNLLEYYPMNGLTMRLKKAKMRPDVFDGLWELWKPILSMFLEDIVSKVEFPPLEYEFQPKSRKLSINL